MKLHAPAKINLTLEVLQRRPDGYHTLRSLMVPLAFGDEVTIEDASAFSFTCDDAALAGPENLAVRAAHAAAPDARIALQLYKHVPTQAGLGGGSSDAAAVLRAAMQGALGSLPDRDWLAIARGLGSDVPFFLCGTGALVEGTGERVTAIGALPPWHVLIVKPPVSVSTVTAYAKLDDVERPSRPRNDSVTLAALDALQRADFQATERLLCNDFHDVIAATSTEVTRAVDALHAAGATNALLCGSGSAVFTLAQDALAIEAIRARLDLPAEFTRIATRFMETPQWQTNAR